MNLAPGTFAGLAAQEAELFRRLLARIRGDGVEIGCMDGYSSAVILDAAPELRLCSVDPFVPDSMEPTLVGDRLRYEENVAPYRSRARLIDDTAQNAVLSWQKPLSFLFIDGDHSYEAVVRDYDQWTPFLLAGGILAVHDSRMTRPGGAPFHPGPSRMAAERIYGRPREWQIVGEVFSLTIAERL